MLCEHALSATDVNAIGCAHGTAHRVAYSSPNSAADSDAERGAYLTTKRFADGHAERNSHGSSNAFADEHADIVSDVLPSARSESKPDRDAFTNSATDGDTERGAHNSADRVTHNNAERDPLCASDERANLHSHVVPII